MMRCARLLVACALVCVGVLAVAPVVRGAEEDEDCQEQELGWLARYGLLRHLADTYPWIREPVVAESLVACSSPSETLVDLSFEPHLSGPGWDRSWTLSCTREGLLSWTCDPPEDLTAVYLAEDDSAVPIADDITTLEALEALATVVIQSSGPGIPDPFDTSEPYRDLTPDAVLSVTREEFCRGAAVTIQIDDEEPKLQLCVESGTCRSAKGPCPLSVRVQGTIE